MAAKKTSRKHTTSSGSDPSLQEQAEQLQQKLGESAQQIWLAGVGAFGRAQTEGTRLFDTLVKEGSRVEQRAGTRAGKLRDAVDSRVHGARERATESFTRVDQVFRSKVQGALKSLEVPTRRELGALLGKIDALNNQLRKHNGQTAAPAAKATKSAARKTATRKAPATRPVVKKAAAKRPAVRPAAKKSVSKTAVKKSPRRAPARKAAP